MIYLWDALCSWLAKKVIEWRLKFSESSAINESDQTRVDIEIWGLEGKKRLSPEDGARFQ